MKLHRVAIKRYKEHRKKRKEILFGLSLLEVIILSLLIVGGSSALYYSHKLSVKAPVKVTASTVKPSVQLPTTPNPNPTTTTTPATTTPKTTNQSAQSSSDSNQALQYENEAIAAEKQAEQEKFCLNIDSLAYGTFKNTQSSALSEVESQIASIDAENTSLGRPVQDTYAPITQVYETYNSTVNTAYSTYTASDTSQGCQPTDTTPPSNYTVPFNG